MINFLLNVVQFNNQDENVDNSAQKSQHILVVFNSSEDFWLFDPNKANSLQVQWVIECAIDDLCQIRDTSPEYDSFIMISNTSDYAS